MATQTIAAPGSQSLPGRYDRKLAEILAHAARVFCEKGYEGASMRDLSRASGTSLAGLYYYFDSKEKLLYLIQRHTFTTILERLRHRLRGVRDPEERVRVFLHNHLEYFLANKEAMKVLSHEADKLTGDYAGEVASLKREYYRIAVGLVDELKTAAGVKSVWARRRAAADTRIAVLTLFGMINWIYTWHKPRVDEDARALADHMSGIFLRGLLDGSRALATKSQRLSAKRSD